MTALIKPMLRVFGSNNSQVTFPPSARIEYLNSDEITVQNLTRIFELGGYKITPDGESSLILEDCGTMIFVLIFRESNLMRFLMTARFKDGVTQQQIHEFLININFKTLLMVRCSSKDGRLMMDYDLPCDGGVLVCLTSAEFQRVQRFRKMQGTEDDNGTDTQGGLHARISGTSSTVI